MDPSSPAPLRVMDFSKAEHFGEGLVLLVDKPLHWTSFDVVNKLRGAIRGALGYRKMKVGPRRDTRPASEWRFGGVHRKGHKADL